MHDLDYFREHLDQFTAMAQHRGIKLDLDSFRSLDRERRELITSTERLKERRRNSISCRDRTGKWENAPKSWICPLRRKSPARVLLCIRASVRGSNGPWQISSWMCTRASTATPKSCRPSS